MVNMNGPPEHIFRAYDIRGVYATEIDEEFAFEIGKAFGTLFPGKIVVGMDVRTSSPSLKKKVVEGLLAIGCDVIDIDIVTTPMTLFATRFYNYDGGIMVTASHNPKEFNGFLFTRKGGVPISIYSGLKEIKEIFDNRKYAEDKVKGNVTEKNIIDDYTNHVLSKINLKKPVNMKVVIDAGNATAGKIYPEAFRRAGIEVVELFCEHDGNFPNRDSDPSKHQNLHHVQQKVLEMHADLGFAYDCVGDRMAVIDERGKIIYVGVIFSIFIKNLLKKNPGEKVVYTFLDSNSIVDVINTSGGIPTVCKVGHTFITEKMLETGAIIAGELSGHYFFKEMNYADDSLFGSLKLVEFLQESKKKIVDYDEEFPKYYSEVSETNRFSVRESEKFPFIDLIRREFENAGHKIETLEGAKVIFEDGWLLVRASNTEAKIALSYESKTKEGFEKLKQMADGIIARIPK